ncbi:hypothetical protein MTR_6g011280 [Medicago truncatula]|uniref:Uncharacterized protein n=1 Tax=Medicago truncatula TaxID=3880 RepID=A0A072U778_MEDTR|nr:hypothetical protein MTR_6g011280 [Medicago truncatula]
MVLSWSSCILEMDVLRFSNMQWRKKGGKLFPASDYGKEEKKKKQVDEAALWGGRALGLMALLEALSPLRGFKIPFGGLLGPYEYIDDPIIMNCFES